ncbi:MAG: 50S ribosome-binding GTPase [Clostridiales bacterium]|jgi:flagellar biosynthesis protein FlhF|nr:50S ribosome-binding GTPase [Clostridiales bacterium]
MKIRKYTGANAQEAIQKVKQDLGADALIISTKRVRQKGIAGFFKKPLTEVMAAVDESARQRQAPVAIKSALRAASGAPAGAGAAGQGGAQPAASPNDVFARFQSQLQSQLQQPGPGQAAAQGWDGQPGPLGQAGQAGPGQSGQLGQPQPPGQPSQPLGQAGQPDLRARPEPPDRQGALWQAGQFGQAAQPPRADAQAVGALSALEAYRESNRAAASNRSLPSIANQVQPAPGQQPEGGADRLGELESKVARMEGLLAKVYQEVSISSKLVQEDGASEQLKPLTKVLQLFYNNLVKNEVEPEYSMSIVEKVGDSLACDEGGSDAATVLYNEVHAALGKPETISIKSDGGPTVAIFVGPTGVGKTTTLAKIAADYALNRNLKVGMVTADTYRIAAVQQLKIYAEILGIPLSVIYTPAEARKTIDDFADKDLILIDTAGRSHRNKAQFDELRELLSVSAADEVFLVLSSTSSMRNNREIINNYGFLDEFKLIFTKADETPTFGTLLNARMMTGKCLSYVTVGQSVPDDIEVASVEKIARNLIGSLAE